MKKLLLFICFIPFIASAQTDPAKDLKDTLHLANLPIDASGLISYNSVIPMPGLSKADLYQRARIWAALAFNSAKYVTQYDDDAGTNIIIKGTTLQYYTYRFLGTSYPVSYYMSFSLQFTFKDNAYRVIFNKFNIETLLTPEVASTKYDIEGLYQLMREWNGNIQNGNMEFNRMIDLTKRVARMDGEIINNVNTFATAIIADIKKQMVKSAKGDDF